MTLKSIGVLSCGKVLGVTYGLVGLIFGFLTALFLGVGAFVGAQQPNQGPPLAVMLAMAAGSLVFAPIAYGILGFIGGIIVAAIYNVVAGFIGGIELEFEPR